jgi:hypothetical protein
MKKRRGTETIATRARQDPSYAPGAPRPNRTAIKPHPKSAPNHVATEKVSDCPDADQDVDRPGHITAEAMEEQKQEQTNQTKPLPKDRSAQGRGYGNERNDPDPVAEPPNSTKRDPLGKAARAHL